MAIIYEPPVIASVRNAIVPKEVPLEERTHGKFAMVLRPNDTIGLYGLLWAHADNTIVQAIGHGELLRWLEQIGRSVPQPDEEWLFLGGGFLRSDHGMKRMIASGCSTQLGPVPKTLAQGALAFPGYAAEANMPFTVPRTYDYPQQAFDWYASHGFLDQH